MLHDVLALSLSKVQELITATWRPWGKAALAVPWFQILIFSTRKYPVLFKHIIYLPFATSSRDQPFVWLSVL